MWVFLEERVTEDQTGKRVIQELKATEVYRGQQALAVLKERGASLDSQVSQEPKASPALKALRASMAKLASRENRAAVG